ncbi:MAG: 4-hydroxy-tetrahydrodipicolinate reductase [Hyphomicrobium sp.]|nr:4-hydroxy-tetrahydrodipicolinate reductase [Hyphomicrobium sp.]
MKVAVMGVAGRMGQELVRAAHAAGCTIVGAVEREGSPAIGSDVGAIAGIKTLGVAVTSDALDVISRCEGILDFTSPKATVEFAALAANARAVHVIGTTGLTASDEAHIAAAARHAPIIKAGNMSLGVNLLVALTRRVAEALDEDFDIEIVEMHHRDKVDAPSGTALMLGAAAAEGRDIDLQQRSVRARDGVTGPRHRGDIGFATLRGGSVVGEHKVIFAGAGERIELAHVAGDRSVFARGAVKALQWGQGKAPGLYSMTDVLGL